MKGVPEAMTAEWVPGASLGLVGSAAAWLFGWRINSAARDAKFDALMAAADARDESLRQEFRDLRAEMRAGVGEFRTASALITKLESSQQVVNAVTAKAIESLSNKIDSHDSKLQDLSSTVKLLTELMMREPRKQAV